MFRKASIAFAVSAALLVSNCSSLTPTSVGSLTTTFITDVERAAATVCQAVPEVAAIISLVNAGIGLSVGGVATAFCSAFATAVPTPPSTPAPAVVKAGRRFRAGAGGPTHACAGSICGWRL